MTTELLEAPVEVAEPITVAPPKSHGQLMKEIDEIIFAKTGKHQRVIHVYSNVVTIESFETGVEKEVYRTGTVIDAERWCKDHNFEFIVCNLRRLGKKW